MLKLKTPKNTYLFDNSSGYVIPFDDELMNYIEQGWNGRDLINNGEERSVLLNKYRKLNLFSEYFQDQKDEKWDEEFIRYQIANSYFMNLQLVLTGSCNCRCEYCMYSDKYPGHVDFIDCNMTYAMAQKAIDLFAKNVKNKKALGLTNTPSISFYGGEPLLQFDLIEKITNYAKIQIPDIQFGITTNAVLLNDSIIRFLIKNDFVIAISIDGYKLNHDRNRKLANGKETFDIVWGNLKKIMQYDQEKKIQILLLCCVDKYTDLLVLADFFYDNYKFLSSCSIRINAINQLDTTYYDFCDREYAQSTVYQKQNQEESLRILRERLENSYYGDKTKKILQPFFSNEVNVLVGSKGTKRLPLNNSCVPGSKLTVLPNGDISPCEKTGNSCIIGNVFDGIDFGQIKGLVEDFTELIKKCNEKKCPIRRVCRACFAYTKDSRNLQEGFCKLEVRSKHVLLNAICENLEKDPNYYEKFL